MTFYKRRLQQFIFFMIMLVVPDVTGSSPVSPTKFTWQGGKVSYKGVSGLRYVGISSVG